MSYDLGLFGRDLQKWAKLGVALAWAPLFFKGLELAGIEPAFDLTVAGIVVDGQMSDGLLYTSGASFVFCVGVRLYGVVVNGRPFLRDF